MSDGDFLILLKDLVERAERDKGYLLSLVEDVEELIYEYDEE